MGFFESFGNALSAAGSAVGAVVETVVEGVTDAVETAVEVVDGAVETVVNTFTGAISNATSGGFIGGFVSALGGIVIGWVRGLANIVVDACNIVRDIGGLVGALLSLDFARFSGEFINLLLDVAGITIDVIRYILLGTIIGGAVASVERDQLRQFVKGLIVAKFSGQRQTDIIEKIGLNTGAWGLPFGAKHKVFGMDSNTIDLRRMHFDGKIDLFAMAGVLSFNSFNVFAPRTYVKVMRKSGASLLFPANRYNITSFLEGNDELRVQVIALKPQACTENMKTAVKAFDKIGVKLKWQGLSPISVYATENIHFLESEDEYELKIEEPDLFDTDITPIPPVSDPTQGVFFAKSGLKSELEGEDPVVAAAAFHFEIGTDRELNGQVSGRIIDRGGVCVTPSRTDSCCSEVTRGDKKTPEGSGVIYRDVAPFFIYKYVLAHEIGHYFGLCHTGHDGFQEIMFTFASQEPLSPNLYRYYFNQEPTFRFEDGKNSWRFIVDQLAAEL